jgi:hypothetical protein
MPDFLKRKKDKNIIILKSTRPNECGGTDATLDKSAPKEIKSEDIVLFDVTSALGFVVGDSGAKAEKFSDIQYISAFASKCGENAFLFLQTASSHRADPEAPVFSLVKGNIFPELDAIVKKYDLAKQNGYNSTTHGLPENFGGGVKIVYSSGERISFSDNQCPVLPRGAARETAKLIDSYLKRESIAAPDVSALKKIVFEEKREGGFTKATLSFLPDGTATNKKASQYDGGDIYESEKPVDAKTVLAVKSSIKDNGLLLWNRLPKNEYALEREKSLTFVFENGKEITVTNDRALPAALGGGFFCIELEMTAKN